MGAVALSTWVVRVKAEGWARGLIADQLVLQFGCSAATVARLIGTAGVVVTVDSAIEGRVLVQMVESLGGHAQVLVAS